MMDWYMIDFLHPSAFKRFTEVMFPNIGVISLSTLNAYDVKKLYQFFDKEGIFLTTEVYNANQWVFSVSLDNGTVFGPAHESKTNRDDIEFEGFLECFRILEKKIKDKI
jgi:hypothetical protein